MQNIGRKGFENGKLDQQTIATFLFACQPSFFRNKLGCSDPLPQPFRNYCRSCLFSQNIDHKKFLGRIPNDSLNSEYEIVENNRISNLSRLSIRSTATFAAPSEVFEDDPDYPHFTDENFKKLYTNVFQKKIDETNLPAAVSKQPVPTFNREVIKELDLLFKQCRGAN